MWFYAGENVSLSFDFKVDGEFVVPTSASYLVRDHLGNALVATTSLTGLTTSATVQILAASNALGSGALYENRYVLVNFIYAGKSHSMVQPYKISAFVPISAVPADVRRLTGLAENELPDQDIDLPTAYFQLLSSFGTDFTTALAATTALGQSAHEAVALQAAINVVSSFPLRVAQSVKAEDQQFTRALNIDWGGIEAELRRKLQQTMTSIVTSTTETLLDIFSVSVPTDPFTGA